MYECVYIYNIHVRRPHSISAGGWGLSFRSVNVSVSCVCVGVCLLSLWRQWSLSRFSRYGTQPGLGLGGFPARSGLRMLHGRVLVLHVMLLPHEPSLLQ